MAKVITKDTSEVNFETLAKRELAQLQRQYRLMETDRQTFLQGKGKYASRQGRMLEYLQNEKAELILSIENATSPIKLKKDKQNAELIAAMVEGYFLSVTEIQAQLDDIMEMESQVDKTNKHVIAQKLKAQALFGRTMTEAQAQKRMRILENRKYHATTMFDTQVAQNARLRNEINLSLMERGRFHERYKQYKQNIAGIKNKMLVVVDHALTTYEGREEAVMKILMLRERNDKESQNHVLEIKEYQRVFHHDQKLRTFMEAKNRHRDVLENAEDRMTRVKMDKEKFLVGLLKQYKRSFIDLLKMAQTTDIDVLLSQYLQQEQRNFASFKLITDLNNEICVIRETNIQLKDKIDGLAETKKRERKNRDNYVKEHHKQYAKLQEELDGAKQEWEKMDKLMGNVIHAVDVLFDKADCSNAPIIQLLGNRMGILPKNVYLCLQVLENRISQLQNEKALLDVKKAILVDKVQLPPKQGLWAPGKKPPAQGGPFLPMVMLTGQLGGEADEDDEEAERALSLKRMTYEEIKAYYKEKFSERKKSADGPDDVLSAIFESLSKIPTKPKFGGRLRPTEEPAQSSQVSTKETGKTFLGSMKSLVKPAKTKGSERSPPDSEAPTTAGSVADSGNNETSRGGSNINVITGDEAEDYTDFEEENYPQEFPEEESWNEE